MTFIQILLVLTSLAAIVVVGNKLRRGQLKVRYFLIWLIVWLGLAVAAILPKTTEILARIVGVGRGVDAVLYFAVVGLMYAVFKIILKQEQIDRDITKIVREMALRDQKNKQL